MNHKERKRTWEENENWGEISTKQQEQQASDERKNWTNQARQKIWKRNLILTLISFHLFLFWIFPLNFIPFRKFVRSCHFPLHMLIIHQFLWKFKSHFTFFYCSFRSKSKKNNEEWKQKQVDWLKCNEIMYL